MNLFSALARAAILFDTSVGLSITSLLGSLGAAGAAVTVTHYFVGFLKNHGNGQARIVEEFKGHHARSQRNSRTTWTACPIASRKTSMTSRPRSPGCPSRKTSSCATRS